MTHGFTEIGSLAVAAIFVQNLVLVWMLASDTFFSALKSPVSGLRFGVTATVGTTLASALGWVLTHFVLSRPGLSFLAPFAFAFAVALLDVAAELVIRKFFTARKRELSRLVQAAAFNCVILGLVLINAQNTARGILGTMFYGFCAGLGFLLALFTAANAMERVRYSTPPKAFQGLPIALVTTGLISLAFMGFSGIQIPY